MFQNLMYLKLQHLFLNLHKHHQHLYLNLQLL